MKSAWMKLLTLFVPLMLSALSSSTLAQDDVIYYHNDALGSPILGTDSNGEVKWKEEYSAYGSRTRYESREIQCGQETCLQVESLGDEKQWFTGQYEETSVGLLYYGARWYEADIGRFLSPDPVAFNEDNIFSFNRYTYANNNPYRYTDPDGESPIDIVFLAVDVSRLVMAVSSGDAAAAQSAAVDVAFSAVGVASPVPGMGQALKVVRGAERAVELGRTVSAGKSAVKSSDIVTKGTGEFSVVDWSGYPAGVPKPQGPFKLVEGAEYDGARKAANQANNQIRQANNLRGQPVDVHEIQPVKFGGSPTDPSNKVILDRTLHRQEVTPWWNQLQKDLGN